MSEEEAIDLLYTIKQDNESRAMIVHNNSSNIQISWSNEDLKDMAKIQQRCANNIRAIDTILDLYKQEKEKNKNCINPDKTRISYFDTKKGMQVVIEGFIPKSKLKQILYPTPKNPIDLEIQNSKMYKDLLKLIGE